MNEDLQSRKLTFRGRQEKLTKIKNLSVATHQNARYSSKRGEDWKGKEEIHEFDQEQKKKKSPRICESLREFSEIFIAVCVYWDSFELGFLPGRYF